MVNWKIDPEEALCALGEIEGDVWFEEQLILTDSTSFNGIVQHLKSRPAASNTYYTTLLGYEGYHRYYLFVDGRIEFAWAYIRLNANRNLILRLLT